MRLVLADSTPHCHLAVANHPANRCGILFSYHYAGENKALIAAKRAMDIRSPIWLDSGVFSARKDGTVIPTRSLIDFALRHYDVCDYVFSMDEGTHEQQFANFLEMHRAGCKVIPIFHADMPLSMLARFRQHTDYLAFSFFKVDGPGGEHVRPTLDRIFGFLLREGLWPCKIHALGTERFDLLTAYPFATADSTGWCDNYCLRQVTVFDAERCRMEGFGFKTDKAEAFAAAQGQTLELAFPPWAGRVARAVNAAAERTRLQDTITEVWRRRGVTFDI